MKWRYLFLILFVLWVSSRILYYSPIGRDSTDIQGWGNRSGMNVYIDNLTGCHYLEIEGKALPRYNWHGEQVGCKDIGE